MESFRFNEARAASGSPLTKLSVLLQRPMVAMGERIGPLTSSHHPGPKKKGSVCDEDEQVGNPINLFDPEMGPAKHGK